MPRVLLAALSLTVCLAAACTRGGDDAKAGATGAPPNHAGYVTTPVTLPSGEKAWAVEAKSPPNAIAWRERFTAFGSELDVPFKTRHRTVISRNGSGLIEFSFEPAQLKPSSKAGAGAPPPTPDLGSPVVAAADEGGKEAAGDCEASLSRATSQKHRLEDETAFLGASVMAATRNLPAAPKLPDEARSGATCEEKLARTKMVVELLSGHRDALKEQLGDKAAAPPQTPPVVDDSAQPVPGD